MKDLYNRVTVQNSKPFWVTLYPTEFWDVTSQCPPKIFVKALRKPTEAEISAPVFLALAYGARGISYWHFSSYYNEGGPCAQSSTAEPGFKKLATNPDLGIMQPSILSQVFPCPPCSTYDSPSEWGGYRGRGLIDWNGTTWVPNDKWFWTKNVNDKVKKIGPTLLNLTWQNAGSIQNAAAVTGGFISSASTSPYGIDTAYVELAFFSAISDTNYFMLVNRRVKGAEVQDVTVGINRTGLYTITDLITDSALIVGNSCGTGFTFKTRLNPGEGKFFKLTPFSGNLHGLAAIDSVCTELTADGDVTVPSGRQMNFRSASKLKFVANTDVLGSGRSTSKGEFVVKGTVVASGNPSNPVVFKSAAASPGEEDWYGVRVEPGGSFKPTRAEFKNAYCGIDYRNSAADVVQNCLFQDNYMYGVRDSLNDNLIINRSRFDHAGVYGVYLDLANATVSEDTFYNVSMAINAYKSYGQIRNNVITTTTSGFFNAIFGFRAEGQVPSPGTQKATFSNDSISGVFDEAAVIANGGVVVESCRIWTKLPAILPDPVPLSIGIMGLGTKATTVRNTTVKMYSSSTSTVPAIQVAGTPVLNLDAYCAFPCPDPPPQLSNRIYRAGTSAKAVQNLTASTVLARTNWWGTSSPTSSFFQGPVTWQPYLASDPGPLGKLAAPSEETGIPIQFSLGQNYPNPFNPTTTISFSLPSTEKVKLKVYNILGQEVQTLVDGEKAAGIHQIVWDGTDQHGLTVSSGLYFYKVQTSSYKEVKRMIFLK